MKTVICYATKTGSTRKAAEKLAGYLGEATLCNLEKENVNLADYDCIIVGGSIRMGQLHKAAKKFVASHASELMEKKCAFFICNGFPEQAETFLVQGYGQELLTHSICAATFGGEMDLTTLKGMDKFIAKAVTNSMKDNPAAAPKMLEENIKEFAEAVKSAE